MKEQFEISVKKILENQNHTLSTKEVVWKGIEQRLHNNRTRKLAITFAASATVIILLGLTVLFINHRQSATINTNYFCTTDSELSETEYYYAYLVEKKQQQLDSEPFNIAFFKPFFDKINELDKQYKEYKNDLQKYGYQEQLVRAMIETRQQKIEVLNRLLIEINKVKSHEKRKSNQVI